LVGYEFLICLKSRQAKSAKQNGVDCPMGLIEKVDFAAAPSRELDAEVAVALGLLRPYSEPNGPHGCLLGYEFQRVKYSFFAPRWEDRQTFPPSPQRIVEMIPSLPRYTASLDDALHLASQIFPQEVTDLLRQAISAEGKRNNRHICFAPFLTDALARDLVVQVLRKKGEEHA
jgi:hypothetical protein